MLDTTRQNWVPFWVLSLAAWTGLGELFNLSEPVASFSKTEAKDASLIKQAHSRP